jgi:hypothetical protein
VPVPRISGRRAADRATPAGTKWSWIAGLAGVIAAYIGVVRPRILHWGVRWEPQLTNLPGDDVVGSADIEATRAITIRAPAEAIWPWVAQMGQARGGLYSYDALENLVGCDMHSADRIVAEWQAVTVGDAFRLHPSVALEVVRVEPGRALVVRGGVPLSERNSPPYDFSWAFVLVERPDATTRLVVRERYRYTRPWAALIVEPVQVISFVMTQKMLRGIRDRAEGRLVTPAMAL